MAGLGEDTLFELRWERSERDLLPAFRRIYGERPEIEQQLKAQLRARWSDRPQDLKDLDLVRDIKPAWFLSEKMIGYVFYVDRFAGNFKGVLEHLDYLEQLGVTYIHFMPCLKPRPGPNDGGYSVMNYRETDPRLGSIDDFEETAKALRARGISVCIDLVLNHTAKEHEWALKARAGQARYQSYYWMFSSEDEPEAYEKSLVEIFPADAPGNFTFYPEFGKWVWTTFHEHQWDLNWSNPEVFLEIVDVMLTLANRGADVLRLDAVAFMWKRLGTNCQNQPEVHDILQALRAATRIAAPALIHKAEAIVAPRDLVPYLGAGRHRGREANLAYHNNLMVQYWSSLASRETALMSHVLKTHFPEKFENASWATYIRCHDDIGWAITEEDGAAIPGISGAGHRAFLADFYSGKFPGSFARGAIFQENPATNDRRNSGSFASLAGLEAALDTGDEAATAQAIARILMGFGLIAAFGGLPLLYMGDEIGLLNDWNFADVPAHAHDNRWLHRPFMDWKKAARAAKGKGPEGQILAGVKHIMARRKAEPRLAAVQGCRVIDSGHSSVFAFVREGDDGALTCLFNFSPEDIEIKGEFLIQNGGSAGRDVLSQSLVVGEGGALLLPGYGFCWLD